VAIDCGLQGNLCESFQLRFETPEVGRDKVYINRQITQSRILTVDRQKIHINILAASRNLFESFKLIFETPKAQRAKENLNRQIVRSRS
jgi:hypothetical protein